MPRSHIDLGPLLGYLTGNKTLKPNPAYGPVGEEDESLNFTAKQLQQYGTESPYIRPSLLETYGNPRLMSDYNQFAYAPAQAAQREALAAQYFPTQLEREQQAQQATREAVAKFADTRQPIELEQKLTEQEKLAEGLAKIKAKNNATMGAMARQQGRILPHQTEWPDEMIGAALNGDFSSVRRENEATAEARFNQGIPSLEANRAALAAQMGIREQNAGLSAGLPELQMQSEVARQPFLKSGYDAGTAQNRIQQIEAETALSNPALVRQTAGNALINKGFREATNVDPSQLGSAPNIYRPSLSGISAERNPLYTPPAVQEFREQRQVIDELKGANTVGAKLGAALGLQQKQAVNTIPLTPNQITNSFPNGAPVTVQTNSPAPNPVRSTVAANPFDKQAAPATTNQSALVKLKAARQAGDAQAVKYWENIVNTDALKELPATLVNPSEINWSDAVKRWVIAKTSPQFAQWFIGDRR